MERKTRGGDSSGGGVGRRDQSMNRSPSELALQEVINTTIPAATTVSSTLSNCNDDGDSMKDERAAGEMMARTLSDADNFNNDVTFASEFDNFLGDFWSGDFNSALKTLDIIQGLTSYGGMADSVACSESHNMMIPSVSAPIDSQSSIYVGSPASANNQPRVVRVTISGSSPEQTDDEDGETETGPWKQSTHPTDLKRMRRKELNRESARRSRRKKLAQLADLEIQVDQLTGENQSLYNQLLDAIQQFRVAGTNNRVLKSDVDALRAKVELAEDMVARGSLTCSLNLLLQDHLLNAPQHLDGRNNLRRAANVSPSITIRADDALRAPGISVSGQNPAGFGVGNAGIGDTTVNNNNNTVMSETASCVTDIWH